MPEIFTGNASISDQYDHACRQIREKLEAMSDDRIGANNDDDLTDNLFQGWVLEPLEEDPERQISASQEREFREVRNDPRFLGTGRVEDQFAVIEVPLVPRASNGVALQLRGQTFLMSSLGHYATFRERDHTIVIRSRLDDSQRLLHEMRQMFGYINRDIETLTPAFRPRVLEMVKRRREQISAHASKFEETMANLGVQVKRRTGAVEPVNVKIKREIRILRDKPAHPQEPELDPDSVRQIVGLMQQSGQGFETAPSAYSALGEEQIRDIILGHLNAVFGVNAATGETFSKQGKTDIFLRISSGSVLIGECKFWDGPRLYGESIDQLFGYLTWRHTVGVLVTFSRNKGMTGVIEQGKKATQEHASLRGTITSAASSYFTSSHVHPSDPEKVVEIHHLFFDLWVGEGGSRIARGRLRERP